MDTHHTSPKAGTPATDRPIRVLLVAITALLGFQMLRVLFTLSFGYLKEVQDLDTPVKLVPVVLAPFVVGLGAALASRGGRTNSITIRSWAGLALAALGVQWSSQPPVEFWFAMVGVASFVWFMTVALSWERIVLAVGLLWGMTLDTLERGIAGTLDLGWRSGPGPWLATLIAVAAGSLVAWRLVTRSIPTGHRTEGLGPVLYGIGPWLFFNMLILQNEGWVATRTGWPNESALLLITAGNAAAIWLAPRFARNWSSSLWSVIYVGFLAGAAFSPGLAFALFVSAALIGGSYYLTLLTPPAGTRSDFAHLVAGMLLLPSFTIVYYGGQVLDGLPQPPATLGLALMILLIAPFVARRPAFPRPANEADWPARHHQSAWLTVPVLIAGVLPAMPGSSSLPATSVDEVQVMTYNIHLAANMTGELDPAAIAAVVGDVDIVAFQEISRGWMIGGSTDLVTMLKEALDMPYVAFFPTTPDPLWGNAIMSKHPIMETSRGILSMEGARPQRGYLATRIDLGDGWHLLLITTHLADRDKSGEKDPSDLHVKQVDEILADWAGEPSTILAGDMNARPGSAEMARIEQAGFHDAWVVGHGDGLTSPTTKPEKRVIWMFHTSDLVVQSVATIDSQASDHRPVVATFTRRP